MKSIAEMRQNIPQEMIDMVTDIHWHMSPGLTLGFKMVLFALDHIEITEKDKVIITAESVRCFQDAVFATCHYLINENGWRIYPKVYDVGKLSMQIAKNVRKGIPLENGKQFRVILVKEEVEKYPLFSKWAYQQEEKKAPLEDLLTDIRRAKDEDIFKIIPFSGTMTDFCHQTNRDLMYCPKCGESVERITTIEINGQRICKICAFFE